MTIVSLPIETFKSWYAYHHKLGVAPPLDCKHAIGVEKDGIQGAAILVQPILHGNCIIFTFITRNPFCDKKFSSDAVDFLIQNLGKAARQLGYPYFVSLVGEDLAVRRYRKNKIKESSSKLSLFWGEA